MIVDNDRLARLRQAVDREHGERIRVTPQIKADFVVGADPARPAFDAVAVPVSGDGGHVNLSGGNAMDWSARLPTQPMQVRIDVLAYPAAAAVVIGDRVDLLDRSLSFDVARVDPNGRTRLIWSLSS